MAEQKDYWDMTEEEFEQAAADPEGEAAQLEPEPGDKGREEPADKGTQEGEQEPFRFSDEQAAEESGDTGQSQPDDQQLYKIVHKGQVHWVTQDKLTELAQKGFDYDTKVGKHKKIAELLDHDPELAQKVDAEVKRKMGWDTQGQQPQQPPGGQGQTGQQGQQPAQDPFANLEVEPADKFNTDEEWLQANMKKALQLGLQQSQQSQQPQQAPPEQPGGMSPTGQMLFNHDPYNFRSVAPYLPTLAEQHLTKAQYDRVNNDPQALIEFYDWVKPQVVGQTQSSPQGQGGQAPPSGSGGKKKPQSFRAKSGGGEPDRGQDTEEKIWEMSNEAFEQEIEKFKGF